MKLLRLCLYWMMALGFSSPIARAQIIYDNLGNDDPFFWNSGWAVGSSPLYEFAFRFTAENTLYLDYGKLALWGEIIPGGTPFVEVGIFTNSPSGILPG